MTVHARVVNGAERRRFWHAYVARAPAMKDYQSFTERGVPVAVLEPR